MNLNIFRGMSRKQTNRVVNEINRHLEQEKLYTKAQTALAVAYTNDIARKFNNTSSVMNVLTQNNLLLMAAISQLRSLDMWVRTKNVWYANGRLYSYKMKRFWRGR